MTTVLKRTFISVVVSCSYFVLHGQNIINDPSFESGGSAWNEIYSVDYPYTGDSFEGYATPSHGERCAGLRLYSDWDTEWHEYLFQFIMGEMLPGMTYRVSFTYRLAPCEVYATDDLGVAFHSSTTDTQVHQLHLDEITPQLRNPEGNILNNNTSTKTFTGTYTATGSENVIIIGCFKNDETISKYQVANTMAPPRTYIYYYIDEVMVVPCPHINEVNLPDVVNLCSPDDDVVLGMNILGASYEWSTGSDSSAIHVPYVSGPIEVKVTKSGCTVSDQTIVQLFSGRTDFEDTLWVCETDDYPQALQVKACHPQETITWQDGTHGQVHSVGSSGIYWYVKTDGVCTASDTVVFRTTEEEGRLYPNPYTDQLFAGLPVKTSILGIADASGRIIFEGTALLEELQPLLVSLSSGTYYVDALINGCRQLFTVEHIRRKE